MLAVFFSPIHKIRPIEALRINGIQHAREPFLHLDQVLLVVFIRGREISFKHRAESSTPFSPHSGCSRYPGNKPIHKVLINAKVHVLFKRCWVSLNDDKLSMLSEIDPKLAHKEISPILLGTLSNTI